MFQLKRNLPNIVICIVILLHLSQVVVNNISFPIDKWIVWDVIHVWSGLFLSALLFFRTDYSEVVAKSLLALLMMISIWAAIEYFGYFVLSATYDWRMINAVVCLGVFGFLFLNILASAFLLKYHGQDFYSSKGVFLVYTPARTIFGAFIGCICGLHSSVSLVIDGEQYAFSRGKIIARRFKTRAGQHFKRLERAPILPARIIGTRWTPWTNCFSVFRNGRV